MPPYGRHATAQAETLVRDLGVSAGRAADEVAKALVEPLQNAYQFQMSFGPADAYRLRTLYPSPSLKGKASASFQGVAFGGSFTTLELKATTGRLETTVSFDELSAKAAAGLGGEVNGLLIDFSATVVNGQNEFTAFTMFGREVVLAYDVGYGAGFKLTVKPNKI